MESTAQQALDEQQSPRGGASTAIKIGVVVTVLAGAVGALLFGSETSDAFVYSKLVHEVMADPSAFEGRELRVEGELRQGSIQFREDPCEWRFVIEKEGQAMPVTYSQCVVPDTFRDGMGISVTVQGKLGAAGEAFQANQVLARCPSKYEMQERMKNGETMPHAATGPGASPIAAEPSPMAPSNAALTNQGL
jgi:cytochrome c-type biogenesis protein CcmE